METIWFILLGLLLILFVVLDGFDFGAGIIYSFVAKDNNEKRTELNAMGPIWDGNEVWLIIGGGVLFFAFPAAYASSFSGYYLALILLLWLLMFRGLSMELRSQLDSPLWRTFWDALLMIGSVSISLVLGVALGNVLRGVPLQTDGFFFLPLWTDFLTGTHRYSGLVHSADRTIFGDAVGCTWRQFYCIKNGKYPATTRAAVIASRTRVSGTLYPDITFRHLYSPTHDD